MLVQDEETVDKVIEEIQDIKLIALDTETNMTEKRWERYLVGFSMAYKDSEDKFKTYYFPFRHDYNRSFFLNGGENLPIYCLKKFKDIFEEQNRIFIFHNWKFDSVVFYKEGIDITAHFRDTMLMAHLSNEDRFNFALKRLSVDYFGEEAAQEEALQKKLIKELKAWEKVPPILMAPYAEKDAILTYQLDDVLLDELREQELTKLWPIEEEWSRTLRQIEETGIRINKEEAKKLSSATLIRLAELRYELGFDPMKPSQLAHRLYASPENGGLGFQPVRFSKRKSKEFSQGLPIMDELILSRIDHPEVEKVLEYRGLVKANSTWYQGFYEKADPQDRVHPEFKQHGTVTGRLSCAKPNMQQLPRDTENTPVKRLMIPTDEYELWEFDYSQIEMRLGTIYADDPDLTEAYRVGEDVHKLTATKVGAFERPELNYEQARYVGKQTNFLVIYQGGPSVLQVTLWKNGRLDLPLTTCQEFIQAFHDTSPGFRKVANQATQVAMQRGFVKLWTGRRRHFKWQSEAHKAFNSIIQGGAAEIVKRTGNDLIRNGYRVVNQVHDSFWIELPVGSSEELVPKIQRQMEWPSDQFEFPFPVDSKRLN